MRPFLFACFLSPLPSLRDTSPTRGEARRRRIGPTGGRQITTPFKGSTSQAQAWGGRGFPKQPKQGRRPERGVGKYTSPARRMGASTAKSKRWNGGSRGCAAWRQRGCAESADCAHPLAILWFLSHRWERNPPRRAEPREEKQGRRPSFPSLPPLAGGHFPLTGGIVPARRRQTSCCFYRTFP